MPTSQAISADWRRPRRMRYEAAPHRLQLSHAGSHWTYDPMRHHAAYQHWRNSAISRRAVPTEWGVQNATGFLKLKKRWKAPGSICDDLVQTADIDRGLVVACPMVGSHGSAAMSRQLRGVSRHERAAVVHLHCGETRSGAACGAWMSIPRIPASAWRQSMRPIGRNGGDVTVIPLPGSSLSGLTATASPRQQRTDGRQLQLRRGSGGTGHAHSTHSS